MSVVQRYVKRKRPPKEKVYTMALYNYTNIFLGPTEGSRMRKLRIILLEGKKHLTVPQRKYYGATTTALRRVRPSRARAKATRI